MAFDRTDPPNFETLFGEAEHLTPSTTWLRVYALLMAAARLGPVPDRLLDLISARTGLATGGLRRNLAYLQKLTLCEPTTAPLVLAMDHLLANAAGGLSLRATGGGSLLEFDRTHWRALSDRRLTRVLSDRMLENPKRYGQSLASVDQAIVWIKRLVPPDDDLQVDLHPRVVNALNAELVIADDGEGKPRIHRPEHGLRHVLPVQLVRDARCPLFDQMLAEMFSNAADPTAVIEHLLELLGYAIQPRRDRATILYLCGSGANGKSTLLKIIQALVGPDLVWSGKISSMTQDRFVLPNTRGCLLAIEDDGEPGEKVKTATLKMLCEHKRISTRLARSTEGFAFNSMLMPIVATNGAPQFDDTSQGLRRRLQVIRFDRQFKPDEMKLGLAEEIIATELPGVLLRLIDGLRRLTARGHFAPPPECEAALDEFLQEANHLTQFLAEQCVREDKAKISLGDLYLALRSWSKDAGLKLPFAKNGLRPQLGAMGFVVRKSSVMVVEGLRLRRKGETDPPRPRARRAEPVTVRLPAPSAAPGPHS